MIHGKQVGGMGGAGQPNMNERKMNWTRPGSTAEAYALEALRARGGVVRRRK